MIGENFEIDTPTFRVAYSIRKHTNGNSFFVDLRDEDNVLNRSSFNPTSGAHNFTGTGGGTATVRDDGDRWFVEIEFNLLQPGPGSLNRIDFVSYWRSGGGSRSSNVLYDFRLFAIEDTPGTEFTQTALTFASFRRNTPDFITVGNNGAVPLNETVQSASNITVGGDGNQIVVQPGRYKFVGNVGYEDNNGTFQTFAWYDVTKGEQIGVESESLMSSSVSSPAHRSSMTVTAVGEFTAATTVELRNINDSTIVRGRTSASVTQLPNTVSVPATGFPTAPVADWSDGDTGVWNATAGRFEPVTKSLVTTIDATNLALSGATTVQYGTGSDPADGVSIVRNDQSQYLQVGNLRYYDVRMVIDEDDAITFTVPGAEFITSIQVNTSVDGGTSFEAPAVTTLPTGANTFTINRDNDINSDTNVQLSFICLLYTSDAADE